MNVHVLTKYACIYAQYTVMRLIWDGVEIAKTQQN